MRKKTETVSAEKLAETVIFGILEKKGLEITKIDFSEMPNSISKYFIICHGTSTSQVDAIADSVAEQAFKQLGEKPAFTEGKENKEWILVDFVDVVVHIFQESTRRFYNIEGLWADAKLETIHN
ncbi:MAG: ribosome silencing factor [Bacteroidales bacterium]|jgi:ribosome-associated protein|nr:ribosome silencing factor [Bacteroidales bacterium]